MKPNAESVESSAMLCLDRLDQQCAKHLLTPALLDETLCKTIVGRALPRSERRENTLIMDRNPVRCQARLASGYDIETLLLELSPQTHDIHACPKDLSPSVDCLSTGRHLGAPETPLAAAAECARGAVIGTTGMAPTAGGSLKSDTSLPRSCSGRRVAETSGRF